MAIQQLPPAASGVPDGTTAQRPSSPTAGDVFYNGTNGYFEIYTINNIWVPINAPADVPTITSATDVGTGRAYNNGAVNVAVSPGTAGGQPVQYTAISSPGSFTATTNITTITVTGLASNTAYTFTATGRNIFGDSLASTASTSVTATTVPQAPTIGTATALSPTSASVTFTPAATGGKTISGYTVTSTPGNITGTGSSSPITVSGLTTGTSYTFKVKATNANGDSLESSASNSVIPVVSFNTDYLIIAGGGAGGEHVGGGGGAGGYKTGTVTVGGGITYTISVGAGGAGGSDSTAGANGSNSSISGSNISTITATGGGGGGGYQAQSGRAGGSGGGGGGYNNQGFGGGTSGEGNDGGSGGSDSGGGGGGSGAVGGNGSTSGGQGGAGTSSSITGSAVTRAGGGGGSTTSGSIGQGAAGGGNGDSNGQSGGQSAQANTGSGGGGCRNGGSLSGSGGSGFVAIMYNDTEPAATSTTGSPTYAVSGGKRRYSWTGSGSITF